MLEAVSVLAQSRNHIGGHFCITYRFCFMGVLVCNSGFFTALDGCLKRSKICIVSAFYDTLGNR